MKTAKHNADQVGHYQFHPRYGTVTMEGGLPHYRDTIVSLFESCGWRVKFRKVTNKPAKRAKARPRKV